MSEHPRSSAESPASKERIRRIIASRKEQVNLALSVCVHCAICADSCFRFRASGGDPTYAPSYKAIHSIGRMVRKKGRLAEGEYREIRELVWHKCVLCMRCYCPLGIDIPGLISAARSVSRERGIYRTWDDGGQE